MRLAFVLLLAATRVITQDACRDFHQFACGAWETAHPLRANETVNGPAATMIDNDVKLLADILRTAPAGTLVGNYFGACMDEAAIERRGLATIQPELDRIAAIRSKRALAVALAHLQQITGNMVSGSGAQGALFNFGSASSENDANRIVFAIAPGALGLPSRDDYLGDDARARHLRAVYAATAETMLRLSGDRDAAADARRVMAIETDLARSMPASEDPHRELSVAELRKLAPHFDWDAYFAALGVRPARILLVSVSSLRGLDAAIAARPLAAWKAHLRWNLLNISANLLPHAFVEAKFEMYGKALYGRKANTPVERRCTFFIQRDLPEEVGRAFVERAFPPQAKERAVAIVHALETAFAEEIDSLDWMSDATKKAAHAKLAAMVEKVGYPDRWQEVSRSPMRRDDALGNAYRASTVEVRRDLDRIGKPRDRRAWTVSAASFDHSYDTTDNSFTVTAAMLQPPAFEPGADDPTLFASVGFLMAHELTHGFDAWGRRFDGEGNQHDWWTAEDAKRFEQRAQCFRDQYDSFVSIDGLHVNGARTLDENIADNGGLVIALRAMHDKGITGPDADRRFFMAFAHHECGLRTAEDLRRYLQSENHAPSPFRINGVTANMPEFAAAFGCKVREPACKIW